MNELNGIGKNISENDIMKSVLVDEGNYKLIERIVDDIVESCCGDLTRKVEEFSKIVMDKNRDLTDTELDYMIMELPCLIYFASDKQESLGLKGDLSKMRGKDLYNRIFVETIGKLAEKEGAAELATQRETLTSEIFSTAYKRVKFKVDIALELISSLKKVISRRIATSEYSGGEDE